eukprot:6194559-Pleurochrysis_carterae.AAC.1
MKKKNTTARERANDLRNCIIWHERKDACAARARLQCSVVRLRTPPLGSIAASARRRRALRSDFRTETFRHKGATFLFHTMRYRSRSATTE